MEKRTQRHKRREQVRRPVMNQNDCENKNCASSKFLEMQNYQIIELLEHLER